KLVEIVDQEGLSALLVTNPTNVTYLTGFTGDSSHFILTHKTGRFSSAISGTPNKLPRNVPISPHTSAPSKKPFTRQARRYWPSSASRLSDSKAAIFRSPTARCFANRPRPPHGKAERTESNSCARSKMLAKSSKSEKPLISPIVPSQSLKPCCA